MVVLNSTSRTSRQLFRITSIKNFRIVKVTLASKALKFGITSPGTKRKQLSSIPLILMPRSGRCGKGNEYFTRSTSCWTRHSPKNHSDCSYIDHETSSHQRREEGRMKLFVAGLSSPSSCASDSPWNHHSSFHAPAGSSDSQTSTRSCSSPSATEWKSTGQH